MFSSARKRNAAAAAAQARQEAALAGAGLGINNLNATHQRIPSNSSNTSNTKPMVSPLQMTFDFELPPSPALSSPHAGEYFRSSRDSERRMGDRERPGTSGSVSLAPPILPPILRVASLKEQSRESEGEGERHGVVGGEDRERVPSGRPPRPSVQNMESESRDARIPPPSVPTIPAARDESDNISTNSRGSGMKSNLGFDPPPDFLSFSRPSSSSSLPRLPQTREERPATASNGSTPRMESSLFPPKDSPSPPISRSDATPAMTRAFIDSRDRPYAPQTGSSQPKRPTQTLQPTYSSPDLLSTSRTTTITAGGRSVSSDFNMRSALSGGSPLASANQRPSPQSSHTSPNLLKHAPTNFSNSTARSRASSKATTLNSQNSYDLPTVTLGTPYQETSPSFPAPHHVATRPKTAGAPTSSMGGVKVPTHHTSGLLRPEMPPSGKSEKSEKGERRRTRLLNPMALLSRRRSGQDEDAIQAEKVVQAAQAAALQRQRNVAAVGVSRMPEDFDPRIRGKVVHDFSAPRHARRQLSQSDAEPGWNTSESRALQTAKSTPFISAVQEESSTDAGVPQIRQSKQGSSDSSSAGGRRSIHTGMFMEHFGESPDHARRISSIQAERLENKDFLQRASHLSQHSIVSQESAILPPFARRSQVMDPIQASLYNDDSSSSGKGGAGERDSGISSMSGISPVTARSSAMQPQDVRVSMSPVSPDSPDKRISGNGSQRPTSAVSPPPTAPAPAAETAVRPPSSYLNLGRKGQGDSVSPLSPSEDTTARNSTSIQQPAVEPIAEEEGTPKPPFVMKIPIPQRIAHEIPPRTGSAAASPLTAPGSSNASLRGPSPALPSPSIQSLASNQPTPEPQIADSVRTIQATSPPRLVEKRVSAVGHAKRASNNFGLPKHHVSNASRFSFQFGGPSAEEKALEEKFRLTSTSSASNEEDGMGVGNVLGDEDEDYFDEDAMDDMDEMEVQAQQQQQSPPGSMNGCSDRAEIASFMYRHPAATVQQKSALQLQVQQHLRDDDSGEEDEDGDEAPYWMTEDFRGYSSGYHTREASVADPPVSSGSNSGVGTGRNSRLTLDTNVGHRFSSGAPAQQFDDEARSGFYMQPMAAGYSPTTNGKMQVQLQQAPMKPTLPHRDSGNSASNRAASGLSFSSPTLGAHKTAPSCSTVESGFSMGESRPFSQSTVGGSSSSEPRTTSTGLGLSGFSDFKFTDSAPPSRPTSLQQGEAKGNENRRTKDSETIPSDVNWADGSNTASPALGQGRELSGWSGGDGQGMAYNGTVGRGIRARQLEGRKKVLDEEDMYFDDGGFDEDVNESDQRYDETGVDEDAFDDERFDFDKVNGMSQVMPPDQGWAAGHQRDMSAMTVTSLGSDGPYPSFAMPNPTRARERDSRLLLEDLPLHEGPVDPKLIPRRNPSEDAKRLGLSDKAPPLPPAPGSLEALQKVNANLQAYHAALAEAANKAAGEGRFLRMPSVSTTRSLSAHSRGEVDVSPLPSRDDRSHYSRNEDGDVSRSTTNAANGAGELDRNESVETQRSDLDPGLKYTPARMSFDFGFDDSATGDYDDFGNDDDIVAAANAEALASDEDGFYGQEFGFYAKARPNSGELLAINGGFFGLDGDDGLSRNKSLKEPNLTPITERSEFSTRNSFIGMGSFGIPSAGPYSAASYSAASLGPISPALARLPFAPENEITSFDQLRKLRAHAFGGSNASLHSDGKGGHAGLSDSPTLSTRSSAAAQGYFGPLGGAPMTFGYSTDSSGSSNPGSAHPNWQASHPPHFQDSPHSAASSGQLPFSMSTENNDATPKRPSRDPVDAPLTARKVGGSNSLTRAHNTHGHSRNSSGTESVTYVQEQDPAGNGPPRWVLERRRTSEQGQLEVIAREIVQGGWI